MHHGILFPLDYVQRAVDLAMSFQPDLVLLLGDYAYHDRRYVAPSIKTLAGLKAPLGTYAVIGNHDIRIDRLLTSAQLAKNKITELTNRGIDLTRGTDRLHLAGIDDVSEGKPNLDRTLANAPIDGCTLLLSHGPDIIERIAPGTVSLVLAGHTHGGQVHLPIIGSPVVPSQYGQKYRYGLVRGPHVTGYVTSGVGCIFPPVRFGVPPEVAHLTLHA